MSLRRAPFLLLAFVLSAQSPPLQLFESVEPHMGTLVRIKLYAGNAEQATAAFRAAFDRIRQLDEILSDYKADSELNRLCRNGVGHAIPVSDDLFAVLAASQKLAAETDGAFDVTLGPVIRLWRQARAGQELPPQAALREASLHCGYRKLHLDSRNRTVALDLPGMQLDLGGIAKGYAADAAIAVLQDAGVHSALAAVSGDLAFSEPPPHERGWKIAIGRSHSAFDLANAAVSTSGDAEQHLDSGRQRYSHIIDPQTNMGLTTGIEVTVIARQGILADGWATALSVLGSVRGMVLVSRHPRIAAIFTTDHMTKSPSFLSLQEKYEVVH